MIFKNIYFSMRFKIIALITLIIFFLCIFSMIEQQSSSNELMQNMETVLETKSNSIGNAISAQFYERYGDVQAFALNPVFQENDKKKMEAYLNQYSALYGIYDLIIYADLNGNIIATNTLNTTGSSINYQKISQENFSKEKWFINTVTKKFTEDSEKKFEGTYFEGPYIDPIVTNVYGTKSFTTTFSAPVYNKSGKMIGVMSNRANFSYIENELIESYKSLVKEGFPKTEITLLDSNGIVIADYDPSFTNVQEYKRDYELLNKLNLFQRNPDRAAYILATKMGIISSYHPRKKLDTIGGFSIINSPKWISSIGWTVLVRSETDSFFSKIYYLKYKFFISICLIGLFFIIISFFVINSVSKKFINISEHLKNSAAKTFITANNMSESSGKVACVTADQSNAVEQSVSAMSEISSMITQTVEHVNECSVFTSTVNEKTQQGNAIMDKLTNSMESIQNANADLQNMANIITEVTNKTSVINDIVFKTQLLSINASIEAARAGQQGKGFSVVAEEVGNLALTSGNAAKEIQTLLLDSQNQISRIIEITSKKISDAQTVSSDAAKEFVTISNEIESINERLKGITQATKEQQIGVNQVVKAMSKMDEATKQNNSLALETNELSKELKQEGLILEKIMKAVQVLILGNISLNNRQEKEMQLIEKLSESWKEDNKINNFNTIDPSKIEVKSLLGKVADNIKSKTEVSHPLEKVELTAEDEQFNEIKNL
ncbi:methyl-accepting chemotaxis protein [Silvanigrella aquatica]|uniref:Methyl-accepting transducer domain-containing protein n=1 Tax=Silvanigrella aquatica TaxID=1915309 RepID=A0A1L4CYX7_9BACT|nr:methyl-accepting chemotaxis protein [Silvanigrella aquatica]APJ03159.1 hypothetical protein AXG55_04265 [Silvanigrella aquatica]